MLYKEDVKLLYSKHNTIAKNSTMLMPFLTCFVLIVVKFIANYFFYNYFFHYYRYGASNNTTTNLQLLSPILLPSESYTFIYNVNEKSHLCQREAFHFYQAIPHELLKKIIK